MAVELSQRVLTWSAYHLKLSVPVLILVECLLSGCSFRKRVVLVYAGYRSEPRIQFSYVRQARGQTLILRASLRNERRTGM